MGSKRLIKKGSRATDLEMGSGLIGRTRTDRRQRGEERRKEGWVEKCGSERKEKLKRGKCDKGAKMWREEVGMGR